MDVLRFSLLLCQASLVLAHAGAAARNCFMCGSSHWQNQQPGAVIAFLRRLSRTKDGIIVLQHWKAVTCAALALAKKITLPVKKAGCLQRRRGHGGKPCFGVLCAGCLSLLVECGIVCSISCLCKCQTDLSYVGQKACE